MCYVSTEKRGRRLIREMLLLLLSRHMEKVRTGAKGQLATMCLLYISVASHTTHTALFLVRYLSTALSLEYYPIIK